MNKGILTNVLKGTEEGEKSRGSKPLKMVDDFKKTQGQVWSGNSRRQHWR